MVDVQQFYFPMKYFGSEHKKRAPLGDISNQPALKKQKEQRDDVGRVTTNSDNRAAPLALSAAVIPPLPGSIKEEEIYSNQHHLQLVSAGEPERKPLSPLRRGTATATSPFDKLPLETQLFIFSFLTTCPEKLNTRLVSTEWDKLLRDKGLRKTVYDQDDVLRSTEADYRVTTNYVSPHFQRDVTPAMRAILLDWLVEVADEFNLHAETFFLAANYLDRYLCVQQVPKSKLQLVGIVCLLIAAKYEETMVPRVDELVFISDNTCTREEIFKTEIHVLAKLQYCLVAVTPHSFLSKFLTHIETTDKEIITVLAFFLIRLAALHYGMLKYPASLIAASALCLALHTCKKTAWTFTLEYVTHYSIADREMQRCVADLHALFVNVPWEDRAAYKKFRDCFGGGIHPMPSDSLPRLSSPKFHVDKP